MIKVANAPCSWGILEFGLEGEAAGYEQVLDEMVATGYAGTELGDWGFMPTEPEQLAREVHSRGLTMLGAFIPVKLKDPSCHAAGIETALRIATLLAGVEGNLPFIVLADENGSDPVRTQNAGRVTPEMGLSEAEWGIFAEGANKLAEAVKKGTGLRTVFHHHCAGYVETPAEVEKLLRLTDPNLLGLVFDTGHYRFGGGDPLEGLRKHADRVWHFHFKDYHPELGKRSRQRAGTTSSRYAAAFSVNWDRAVSISRPLSLSCTTWATMDGVLSSRMFCQVWAARWNRRSVTANF
jgi:inosose dehydratase